MMRTAIIRILQDVGKQLIAATEECRIRLPEASNGDVAFLYMAAGALEAMHGCCAHAIAALMRLDRILTAQEQ